MALTLPTPPTPPTIDKGEVADTAPRIDAHKFFQVPFEHNDKPVAQENIPAQDKIPAQTKKPPVTERTAPTPEQMARDAVANGAGALTKRTVSAPKSDAIPEIKTSINDNPNRGKEVLREFQNEDAQLYSQTPSTPRNIKINQAESHGGGYWIVTLILVIVASVVLVKKFLISDKPALKKSDLFEGSGERLKATADKVAKPVKKNDDNGKHFEVRV